MSPRSCSSTAGITLLELLFVLAIISTLVALAQTGYSSYRNTVAIAQAISDIESISSAINHGTLTEGLPPPPTLASIGMDGMLDPWGNPYQYINHSLAPKGQWRKDRFIVPINSDYDLYSMGPDGESVAPLTAKASQDDIIRANDGAYVGPASGY
ncbi:MAG TPA: prepilin-type cleavage/methylation domain-containing protein [Deltaproteobacteria bacterium]|jgi:general secretion pathway protein G|nr:prepilin-type cleavage/methylation domain-containing protein [Deltaproteobacteria bacterium]